MTGENPYEVPKDAEILDDPTVSELSASQATYNTLSDTVTGANLRFSDNCLQATCILACLLLGAVIGAVFVQEPIPGAITGGLIGIVVGLLGSGIFLMIYRDIRHMKGKHD